MTKVKIFGLAIGVLILVLSSFFCYVWSRVHKELHTHIVASAHTPEGYMLTAEEHEFMSEDGVRLSSWYIRAREGKAVIILVHGFGRPEGGKSDGLSRAKFLHKAGYDTFIIDLRSFGESDGEMIYMGTREWQDAQAAYDYVKKLPGNADKKVGFLGTSMGAATILTVAGRAQVGDFVIAEVPYARVESVFAAEIERNNFASWLVMPFARLAMKFELGFDCTRHEAEDYVGDISVPLFVIEAGQDEAVVHGDGRLLYDLANEPKQYWLADTGHNVYEGDPDGYEKHVLDFLTRVLSEQTN